MNLEKVAQRIRAPRTLLLDREFGTLLGQPGDEGTQRATLLAALDLLEEAREPGTLRRL